jgi:hypothetical protein
MNEQSEQPIQTVKDVDKILPVTIPLFEENRILRPNQPVEQDINKAVEKKVLQSIENAPVVNSENEENYNPRKEINHTIILRYPEDSHLVPLVQKSLFDNFMRMEKELKEQNREVNEITLMTLDPTFPAVKIQDDNGNTITGETNLEHEVAHARVAVEEGQSHVYICLPIIWREDENGRKILKFRHGVARIQKDLPVKSTIKVAVAPKYPSHEDIMLAKSLLKKLDDISSPLWEIVQNTEMGLPRVDRKGLTSDKMKFAFLEAWKKRTLNLK